MGANNNYRNYPDEIGRTDIKKKWSDAVDDSLEEDGNSYSGEIGMLGKSIKWHDKEFDSQDEAEDFIDNKHDKGGDPMAVSYMEGGKKMWCIGGWCPS